MTPRKGTGWCATLLLAVASATGALTGCQTFADAASTQGCEGTESRVDDLKAYGVLDSRPQGAVVPKGFEALDAGCWEDSGEAWVYANRTYAFPGDRADVTRYYRAAAEREGWKPSPATRKSAKEDKPASLCFTLGEKDDSTTLDVYFLTESVLDAEGAEAGPEFDSGAGYLVAVNATADGSATSCSD
ncbi:hypothetical protein F9278_00730 [Streptomyces phaeolivaceus]|uniref:DUF3558 domain-containing protein n=1 Tax=Streptomyces phaeolivaceus TaxID=2653200 RepID=A0A5P8JVD9_9ACTN|nr:hypothetical protein [Streptomyces phaeolivaceus]QFQ94963.1 hypothetical protein F9278_00730 [Streptomyces phaeolivaceus]